MSSKRKACPCLLSDDNSLCCCSEIETESSEEVCSEVEVSSTNQFHVPCNLPQGNKKLKVAASSDCQANDVEILYVEPGKVQREVQIIKVEKALNTCNEVEIVKVIPPIEASQSKDASVMPMHMQIQEDNSLWQVDGTEDNTSGSDKVVGKLLYSIPINLYVKIFSNIIEYSYIKINSTLSKFSHAHDLSMVTDFECSF